MALKKIQVPKNFSVDNCETVIQLFMKKYKGNYNHPFVQVLNEKNEVVLELEIDQTPLWRIKSSTIEFEVVDNGIFWRNYYKEQDEKL